MNKILFLDDKDKNGPTARGTTEINYQILKAFTEERRGCVMKESGCISIRLV